MFFEARCMLGETTDIFLTSGLLSYFYVKLLNILAILFYVRWYIDELVLDAYVQFCEKREYP